MNTLLHLTARILIGLVQALPLGLVVILGRASGAVAWHLDRRHRRVALANLKLAFPEKTEREIRGIARENFRRLGENYLGGIKTAGMDADDIRRILTLRGREHLATEADGHNLVFAIGHFGNFELYARAGLFLPGWRFGVTYRGLKQPALNRLLVALRERSGTLFFERRQDSGAMKAALREGGLTMSFLADQHAGDNGARLPFLGHECSTSTAPAVFALRYRCALHTAICSRTAPGRWRIELGPAIPTHKDGHARSVEAITTDVNAALEIAVRKDPANWFWVHRRWKPASRRQQARRKPPTETGND
jgi:lauroyl/myristoyl acyltransferase